MRLRFSPAFICAVAALLFVPVIGAWALLVFVLPLLAFSLLSGRASEPPSATLSRFFCADDRIEDAATMPTEGSADAGLDTEADQFAREAESGRHGAMGLGDVKLAVAIGALLGPGHGLLSLFLATAAGAITGLGLATRHGKGLRIGIPFGPFMAFGAVVVMLYGQDMIAWYMRTMGIGR